jgi:hypothetical protein
LLSLVQKTGSEATAVKIGEWHKVVI